MYSHPSLAQTRLAPRSGVSVCAGVYAAVVMLGVCGGVGCSKDPGPSTLPDAGDASTTGGYTPTSGTAMPTTAGATTGTTGTTGTTTGATGEATTGTTASPPTGTNDGATAGTVRLPPTNAGFDYQIGGAYAPPAGVTVVSRDRGDAPAAGLYNICYVNGFQAQPGAEDFWLRTHPTLVLRDDSGDPVIDEDWDEMLLDVGSDTKRAQLAVVVGDWIAGCAAAGFNAVEVDNLDTFSRSGGRLKMADAVAFIRLLADRAHAEGLAIAQKNAAEMARMRAQMGTDFVVAEECNEWHECGVFTEAYGDEVFVVEYKRSAFQAGCSAFPNLSIVLRDLDVSAAGSRRYVFEGC